MHSSFLMCRYRAHCTISGKQWGSHLDCRLQTLPVSSLRRSPPVSATHNGFLSSLLRHPYLVRYFLRNTIPPPFALIASPPDSMWACLGWSLSLGAFDEVHDWPSYRCPFVLHTHTLTHISFFVNCFWLERKIRIRLRETRITFKHIFIRFSGIRNEQTASYHNRQEWFYVNLQRNIIYCVRVNKYYLTISCLNEYWRCIV